MVFVSDLYPAQNGNFNLTAKILSGDKRQGQQETA
jgi:hypothetical protein